MYAVYSNALIEKVRISNESVLNVLKNDLVKVLDDIEFMSTSFILDNNVKTYLRQLSGKNSISTLEDYKNHRDLKSLLSVAETRLFNQDIHLFLVNDKDFVITPYSTPQLFKQSFQQWSEIQAKVDFEKIADLQFIGVTSSPETNESYVYFTRVIIDSIGHHPLGYINMAIKESYFTKLFSQVSSGDVILYDADNHIIASSNNSLEEVDYKDRVQNEVSFSNGEFRLVLFTEKTQLTNELTSTFYSSLFVIIIFSIVFIILSLLAAYRMHYPIKNLKKVTESFGEGNRHVRYKTRGTDEINQLGMSINKMFTQINELIESIKEEQQKQKELEIQALYSQIRPHFLMNTLNSIRVNLVVNGDLYHSKKIQSLTMLLRKYLKMNEPSTLQNECELLEHYVDIMKMRSEMDIHLEIMIPDYLKEVELPFLMLQPIVENSILHGFDGQEVGTITIYAMEDDGKLTIQLSDDGVGMSQETMDVLNHRLVTGVAMGDSVGLMNIKQRLDLIYNHQVSLTIDSEDGFGTTVEINIPLEESSFEVNQNV